MAKKLSAKIILALVSTIVISFCLIIWLIANNTENDIITQTNNTTKEKENLS